MKKSHIFQSLILLALVSCFACEKTEAPEAENLEYFIFGHFYGECMGEECVEIYKIENGELLEDINDIYPLIFSNDPEPYPGDFQLLDQSIFEEIRDIENRLPADLYNETEKVIGQPDAGDWGGIYIEVFDGTQVDQWFIDTMHDNLPDYLPDFVDAIQEAITAINN